MAKTRILLVDDAVVVRRLLTDAISEDPNLEVVGTASNGRIALSKIPVCKPDLIILDVEMPEMDGLQTLVEVRKLDRKIPIIMYSTLTQRGAAATLEALSQGANDYATKPSNAGNFEAARQSVCDQLLPKIKQLCRSSSVELREKNRSVPLSSRLPNQATRSHRIDLLAIGVSTGGPNALAAILAKLPVNFPVPIVIVQHMPPVFTGLLARRLTACSPLSVYEASEGVNMEPGQVWLAPGDFHMVVERGAMGFSLHVNQEAQENSCRPAVDVLFRSVASACGKHSLGVILTGMGQDGLRGCEAIRSAGGTIFVQDRESSVVWGMPGQVARAGLADQILSLNDLTPALLNQLKIGRTAHEFKTIAGGV